MAKGNDAAMRQQLIELIKGGNAHVELNKALDDFPVALRGRRPEGSPYSPWELHEHMRIAQWDILEFSRNPDHESPKWPEGYWPATPEPPDSSAWDQSIDAFSQDMRSMCALIADEGAEIYAPFPHGSGQTLLREALLVGDHNAYHLGQLVLLRRILGAWTTG
jgi:hypothetical protein